MTVEPISGNGLLVFQLSTTFAWQSHLIRVMCNSEFSHADLVLEEGLLGVSDMPKTPVISGNPDGVAIRAPDYEPMKVRQRVILHTPKADAIVARIRTQLGKPFDGTALHAFLHSPGDDPAIVSRDWRSLDRWFCVELLAWGLEAEGFWPFEILVPENRVTPQALIHLLNPYMDIDYWHASRVERATL